MACGDIYIYNGLCPNSSLCMEFLPPNTVVNPFPYILLHML